VVTATDNGTDPKAQTSTATVTINIKDLNDNDPVFEKNVYNVTIPETHTGVVITISGDFNIALESREGDFSQQRERISPTLPWSLFK
jgi:hypothetical protein